MNNDWLFQLRKDEDESIEKLCRDIHEKKLGYITDTRLRRIEKDVTKARPEEILLLSKAYDMPALCNEYCTQHCSIGKEYVSPIKTDELEKIILRLIASMNLLNKRQERLIEIASDGKVDDSEQKDFNEIRVELQKAANTIESLLFWTEKEIKSALK